MSRRRRQPDDQWNQLGVAPNYRHDPPWNGFGTPPAYQLPLSRRNFYRGADAWQLNWRDPTTLKAFLDDIPTSKVEDIFIHVKYTSPLDPLIWNKSFDPILMAHGAPEVYPGCRAIMVRNAQGIGNDHEVSVNATVLGISAFRAFKVLQDKHEEYRSAGEFYDKNQIQRDKELTDWGTKAMKDAGWKLIGKFKDAPDLVNKIMTDPENADWATQKHTTKMAGLITNGFVLPWDPTAITDWGKSMVDATLLRMQMISAMNESILKHNKAGVEQWWKNINVLAQQWRAEQDNAKKALEAAEKWNTKSHKWEPLIIFAPKY